MVEPLTKKQKIILDFVRSFSKKKGYSPTHKEIGKKFKLSVSSINQYLTTLKEKGYIQKDKGRARSIEISKIESMIKIPLFGFIAAGKPIEPVINQELLEVSKNMLSRTGKHYALRVQGNSMLKEGIFNGDTVIVREQPLVENGETAVAYLPDKNEATLKKIYIEKNRFRLQPANPAMKPFYEKNVHIQGKVINVIRNLEEQNEKKEEFKENTEKQKTQIAKNENLKKYLNKVFLGDVMELLKNLPDQSVNMVFGDPDYNVGVKYGDKTYTKNFEEYINWYIDLTKESLRVLKNDGNLFMLNYPKQNAHLRVKYLDNIYPLVHEYAWVYNTNVGHTPKRFTTAHRTILHVRKRENNKFYKDNVALPYKNPGDKRIIQNLQNGSKGRMPYSWFEFNLVKNVSKEKTYHACQIPQKLTEMLVKATTKPKDTVLILFGGSGSELEVCKQKNRQYISAEIDPKYHEIITDRLKNGYIQKKYKLQLRHERNNFTLPLLNTEV